MSLEEIAARLAAASSEDERQHLLTANAGLANLDLAFALKEICYAAWTNQPTQAQAAAAALDALARFNPAPKIAALAVWIDGIAAITRGAHEQAAALLEQAGKAFQHLNENHLAAQTQVAKLYALALIGKYDEAIETGKRAIETFEAHQDFFAVGKIEHNLGNIYWRRGDYPNARRYFADSYERFKTFDDERQLIMVEHCLADIDSLQNDFRSAEKLFEKALERAAKLEMLDTQAKIEANIGNLALFRGRYDEALKSLEKSRRKYFELKMPHETALADLEIADVYLELNLLPEAKTIYERVAPQFAAFKMRAEEARTRTQLGKALSRLGENEAALIELEQAETLYQAEKNALGAATVKLYQANLQMREKRYDAAINLALSAENAFASVNSKRNALLARLVRGESERCAGNFAEAETVLSETISRAEAEELPQIVWAGATSLGLIAEQKGDAAIAEKYFTKSVEIIEKLRSPLAADDFRTAFFADKLAPYQKLAEICRRDKNRITESFAWIERARSQALLDLMTGEGGGEILTADKNLQGRLDNLREELNWFYSRSNRPANAEEIQNWQSEIRSRESEINALVLQIEASRQGSAKRADSFDMQKLQNALGADRILLEFTEVDGEFAAFVVGSDEIRLIENLGKADDIQKTLEQIHFQFGTLRYGAAHLEKHLPQLKRRVEIHLQNLYEILLRPLEEFLSDKNLVIVPSGNLNYVPFQALHDGENYVVEKREVSFAPSAAVLLNLLGKDFTIEKALAVGFADERVPQVEREVETLSTILPNAQILKGEAATFAAMQTLLQSDDFDVLHLACHGQFRAENPLFSSLHLADGWATVREAARLRLSDALVVLSACETGLSKVAAGEELLGLVRGFLAAGANALVLSLWTVNDAATANLMLEFYHHLINGKSLAQSLRAAQIKFIEQNAHPYFWSSFVLTGKW